MQAVCLAWGILSIVGMIIAFFPCLGALNWLNIPFSVVGLLFCLTVQTLSGRRYKIGSLGGAVLCATAIGIGLLRLGIGFGLL